MKKLLASICLLLGASASFAQTSPTIVRWQSIVGVITAQNVNNPIANGINSGTFAWSTGGGTARVDLETGATTFHVDGLVINGTSFSGTPGPVTKIEGTLVCNAGTDQQSLHDTPAVKLDAEGNARFNGTVGAVPATCGNPDSDGELMRRCRTKDARRPHRRTSGQDFRVCGTLQSRSTCSRRSGTTSIKLIPGALVHRPSFC